MESGRSTRLSRGFSSGGDLAASVPVLVGRDQERARLGALVDAVSAGHGQIAVLAGEAGIGKSRLAAEVLADCAGRGFEVFSAAADEVEQRRPFGVVIDALRVGHRKDGARGEIGRLLAGDLVPAGGLLGLEWRIADLLVSLVEDACTSGPVAVALDDLQWADESSLTAASGMARLVSSSPLLLVCVARPYPAGRPLRALLASLDYRRAFRLELAGLTTEAVAALAEELAGAPPDDTVCQALAGVGGNPFYVSELLGCLTKEGGARVTGDGVLGMKGVGLPPSLRLTILDRLRFLPDDTLTLLRAASVLGRSFSVREVSLISPSSVADVVAALAPAQEAGIVVANGERLLFRHDLIREAIYNDLAPAVRASLHRFLASGLAESGAGWERVAAQLMLGAEPGDAEAIGWLRRAAGEVRATSPAIAAQLLGRALELCVEPGPVRMAVLVELVLPLMWTGQVARAEKVCLEALQAEPPATEKPLFWLGLVNSRVLRGRFAEARATCDDAMECDQLTESDRLHVTLARALSGIYLGDPEGLQLARELVSTAPRSTAKGSALDGVAQWELFTGHADRAVALYQQREAMMTPPEIESRIWQGSGVQVKMWNALALLDLDRVDEAVDMLDRDLAAKVAVPGLPHAFRGACRYQAGRFGEAMQECDAAVAAAEAAGSYMPASALALSAVIALRQGRLEDADRLTARAEQVRTPAEAGGDTIARWARTLLLEATGRGEEAADEAAAALTAYQRAGFASYVTWHAPDMVRVALAAGRLDQAELAMDAAERVADQVPVASRRAGALRARGLLADDPAILQQALAAAREAGRPVDLAMTLRDAAVALAHHGQQEQARPLAVEALELLGQLGAAGDERHARKLLRAAGLSVSVRAKHTRADHGWDSLTEAERQVLKLAVEGRSNPEIAQSLYLSRRTVGWHLSNIFRKVGVASRGELIAEALRRKIA